MMRVGDNPPSGIGRASARREGLRERASHKGRSKGDSHKTMKNTRGEREGGRQPPLANSA